MAGGQSVRHAGGVWTSQPLSDNKAPIGFQIWVPLLDKLIDVLKSATVAGLRMTGFCRTPRWFTVQSHGRVGRTRFSSFTEWLLIVQILSSPTSFSRAELVVLSRSNTDYVHPHGPRVLVSDIVPYDPF